MSEREAPAPPGDSRPGIVVRGFPPGAIDEEFLSLYFQVHGGDIKQVAMSEDKQQAYLEFTDPSVIPTVVAKSHIIRKCPVTVDEIDLHQVWLPYLIVKGFPPFVNDQLLKQHFEKVTSNAEIQSIEIKEGEASIVYMNPKIAFQVASQKQVLIGTELTIEIGYCSPKAPEECVLTVKGLPDMEVTMLKPSLEWYFKQSANGGHEVTSCDIIEGVAYVQFADPSAVHEVVSHPPTQEFLAGSVLQMSATPVSKIPGSMATHQSPPIDIPVSQQHLQSQQPAVSMESSTSSFSSTEYSLLATQSSEGVHQQEKWATPVVHCPSPIPQQRRAQSTQSSEGVHQQEKWATPVAHCPSPIPQQRRAPSPGVPMFVQQGHATHLLGTSPVSHSAVFQQSPSKQQQPLVVEDFDSPFSQPTQPVMARTFSTNKVLVEGFPDGTQEFVLQLFLQSLSQGIQCTGMTLHGKLAVATFERALDINTLLQRSRVTPFPQNKEVLTLSPVTPSDTVLVSNLPPNTPDFATEIYFDKFAPIARVKSISPTQALITFKSHEDVQKVLQEQHYLGSVLLSLEEYHPFMQLPLGKGEDEQNNFSDPNASQPQAQPPPPTKHIWSAQKKKISNEKYTFLQRTLGKLNRELESVHADASIEDEPSGKSISIKPLPGSVELSEWEDSVHNILQTFFTDFKEEKQLFTKEAKLQILEYLETVRNDYPDLYVSTSGNTLVIAGNSDVVDRVLEKAAEISEEAQVTCTDLTPPRKHIKYLKKFCKRDLDSVTPLVDYNIDPEAGVITVTANPKGQQAFMDMITQKTASIPEKVLRLNPEGYKLLCSKKGVEKIESIMGPRISHLVYDFEVATSPGVSDGGAFHQLCILSTEMATCKEVKKMIQLCVQEKPVTVSQAQLKVCSSQEWQKFEQQLTDEFFVAINVKPRGIVVTGEAIVIGDIGEKIQKFLSEQTNIEIRVEFQISEWRVLKGNCSSEISGIKDQAKSRNVIVVFPRSESTVSTVVVTIRGEHAAVSDIKVQVEMLKNNVHKKTAKVAGVPALMHVLKGMEDRLKVLETNRKVVIEVDVESGENGGTGSTQPTGELPRKVCGATAPDATRVSVFIGDFTQQQHVGTFINFITPNPDVQQGHLKLLIEVGGAEVQSDFQEKISQFMGLNPPQVFKSRHGQLKCMQLLHCVIPPWSGGNHKEALYLEESLKLAVNSAAKHSSLLLAPITSTPFKYPPDVFASKVIEVLASNPMSTYSADVQIMIHIDDLSHANYFEECLKARNYQIHTTAPHHGSKALTASRPDVRTTSAKAISSSIGSFIKVTKGDMLQQQADVYINSTNRNLDLSQGQIAPALLKACGKELQKECEEYAPLEPGAVVDTAARNLKCKYIFHVALPDYKTKASTRIFRETVQNILRAAHAKRVTSIVIPSLGVGNLHYPADVSARILFDEVMAFHARNPTAIQMFYFVIYQKQVYETFNKEYAQLMTGSSTHKQDSPSGATAAACQGSDSDKGNTHISVIQGNIADESTDVMVNTTTEDMNLSSNAVSRAIAKKAGPKLQSVCHQLVDSGLKLEHGKIAVTAACGQLHCKKVFHAHVPIRSRLAADPKQLIEKIVMECLQKTTEHSLQSISFPAFGIGAGGYSVTETAEPMLKALQSFGKSKSKSVKTVRIVILDQGCYQEFHDYFCKFFNKDPAEAAQAGHGFLHSIGSSIKATLGMGQEKGVSVDLQSSSGVVSVRSAMPPPSWVYQPHALSNPVALFRVFASSPQTGEQVCEEIRKTIRERSAHQKIEEEAISYLIDDDIREILDIGKQFGVVINLMLKIKEITISGEKGSVTQAQMKITSILHDVEGAQRELRLYEWQSDDDGEFESYPPEASVRLERAYTKKLDAIEMTIDDVAIVVDLKRMIEISKSTGKERTVRRAKRTQFDYPDTWERQPEEGGRPKPSHMFEVDAGSTEFQDAVKEFELSMTGLKYTIVAVKRIQTPNEYMKHCALRQSMQQKHGKKVQERRLFHGTRQESINAIAVQGFNRIFAADANAACFGKGAYFAVNAYYSAQEKYATPDSSGNRHMFVCNVLIGQYTQGNSSMKTAPQLNPSSNLLYDSLVDRMQNPTIFVAMTDSQAYPEYLITYKIDKSK